MLRRHASLIIGCLLILLVVGACLVRTGPSRRSQRGQPVYVQKHKKDKKMKPVKHRKHRH